MPRVFLWMSVCLASLVGGVRYSPIPLLPVAPPPAHRAVLPPFDRVIRLDVEYDEALAEQHGDRVEDFVRETIAIHNVEWRRYRREWFQLGRLTLRPSTPDLDASYVLAKFLHRTTEEPDTIHVLVTGRPLEVYTSGTHAMPIGGLAYRGSDALVVTATPGVTVDLLAYYLFHELGHCWDAYDIPFHGGDTTFGSKTRMTFDIDAGNEEIMEDSAGPLPRATPKRAPMVIREKLARARAVTRELPVYTAIHDLLLHEPSPSNPVYIEKKGVVLARAGADRVKVADLLRTYEITRRQLRDDAEVWQQIAEHYWRANDAIRKRDYEAADAELQMIRVIGASPDVHMLVGAVEKKVRRRR
ncbi:MAG TPA: hypothetical protein VEK57_24760 [Thermoanaerobaculia bacterium]|nr:hypothetical protein [Thermoanaerobaculia bacterium]